MKIDCPECSTTYELPDQYVGKKLKCKKCEAIFEVEDPEAEVADESEIEEDTQDLPEDQHQKEAAFDMDGEETFEEDEELGDSEGDFEISFDEGEDSDEEIDLDDEEGSEPKENDEDISDKPDTVDSSQSGIAKDADISASASRRIKTAKKSGGNKLPVIILAVLLIIALGGAAFTYLKWQESKEKIAPVNKKLDLLNTEVSQKKQEIDTYKTELGTITEKAESLNKKLAEMIKNPILFYDSFENNLIEDRWLVFEGNAEVTDKGRMKIAAEENGAGVAFCKIRLKGDVQIEYDCNISPLKSDGKISDLSFLLAASTKDYLKNSYFFGIGSQYNSDVKVLKRGEPFFLSKGSPIKSGGVYHYRIVARDEPGSKEGSIKVYITDIINKEEEKLIIDLKQSPLPPLYYYFGFYTFDSQIQVDNVKMVKLSE